MVKKIGLTAALFVFAPFASAGATDVATFLAKAEVAQRKGPAALLTSDGRALMSELRTATKALKAERMAAEAAGRRPAYCPTGKAALSQKEVLASLQAVPPAERAQVEVKDAMRAGFARKYPCVG